MASDKHSPDLRETGNKRLVLLLKPSILHFKINKKSTLTVLLLQGIEKGIMYIPNICFCSCGGAEANIEAVKGS